MKIIDTRIILLVVLIAIGNTGFLWAVDDKANINDVPANHWARSAIERMVDVGLTYGLPGTEFGGANKISKYELMVMFDNIYDKIEKDIAEAKRLAQTKPQFTPVIQYGTKKDETEVENISATVANRKLIYELKDELDSILADIRALQSKPVYQSEGFKIKGLYRVGIWENDLLFKDTGDNVAMWGVAALQLQLNQDIGDALSISFKLDCPDRRWEQNLTPASFKLNAKAVTNFTMGEQQASLIFNNGSAQYTNAQTGEVVEGEGNRVALQTAFMGVDLEGHLVYRNLSDTLAAISVTGDAVGDPTNVAVTGETVKELGGVIGWAFPLIDYIIDFQTAVDICYRGAFLPISGTNLIRIVPEIGIEGDKLALRFSYGIGLSGSSMRYRMEAGLSLNDPLGIGTDLKLSLIKSSSTSDPWSDPYYAQNVVGVDIFNEEVENGVSCYSAKLNHNLSDKILLSGQLSLLNRSSTGLMERIKMKVMVDWAIQTNLRLITEYRSDLQSATYTGSVASNADSARLGMQVTF